MAVKDYLREQGMKQLYEEMRKIREIENAKTKEEVIEEVGSGGGGGTPSEPKERINNDDIDNIFG
jgi:hypothetical protein